MARPRKENPRAEQLAFRVTAVEKAKIAERARAAGMPIPDFLRARALGLKPRGLEPIAAPPVPPRAPVNPVVRAEEVRKQEIADEVAEAMLEDPAARDAFLDRRTKQLVGAGSTTLVARRKAAEEWATRGQDVAQTGRGT
jgi:hypothetical protein